MSGDKELPEFAVYVGGVGAVSSILPGRITVGADEPTVFGDGHEAFNLAKRVMNEYKQLGLPDVARRVQIVTRTVYITRDEWSLAEEQAVAS